jgi:serine/threonine protein kinase
MTKETATPAAGVMLGRYRVESELGRGGMGVVYGALDGTLGRRVAVKTLSAGLLGRDREARMTRFQREVRALAQLDHPGILHIYDAGEADDPVVGWVLYYSMELIEGETLSERLIRCGAMERGAACAVVAQCADALGSAHRRGIVHRDVKPANIFLSRGGRVVVADFGVCKIEGGQEITRKDQMVGTPSYLAPEQILGLPVDPRTDVFALGALLYVLISNSALRPQLDRAGLSKLAATDDAAWRARHMPNSTAELRDVVAKALARDPADRFASGVELAEALEPFATRAPDPFEPANGTSSSGSRLPAGLAAHSDSSGAFTHGGNTDPGGPPNMEPGGGDTQVDTAPPVMVSDEVPQRARRLAHRMNAAGHADDGSPDGTHQAPVQALAGEGMPPANDPSDPTEDAPLPRVQTADAAEATDMVPRGARPPAPTQRVLLAWGGGSALVVLTVAALVWAQARPNAAAPPTAASATTKGQPQAIGVPASAAGGLGPAPPGPAAPAALTYPQGCTSRPVPAAQEREAKALVDKATSAEQKDPAKAQGLLERALTMDGRNWAAHLALARIHVASQRTGAARPHYQCVISIRGGQAEARIAQEELAALVGP